MNAASYYDREAAEVAARKAKTPRATALLSLAHDVLDETLDETLRLRLGGMIFDLTTFQRAGRDVPEEQAKEIEDRLRTAKVAR